MFTNTIDNKQTIVDPNGNTIIDFTTSVFADNVYAQSQPNAKHINETYQMRPDKIAYAEYKTTDSAEFILKYTGISNPFSLDKDDIIIIPEESIAKAQMRDMKAEEKTSRVQQIRNYFKFTNTDFNSDKSSYNDLDKLSIPSGIPKETTEDAYKVPYISDDGATAITIRNGRMYFGEDNNTATSNVDEKIKSIINNTASALADKCVVNGLSLTDFVRANNKNNNE